MEPFAFANPDYARFGVHPRLSFEGIASIASITIQRYFGFNYGSLIEIAEGGRDIDNCSEIVLEQIEGGGNETIPRQILVV